MPAPRPYIGDRELLLIGKILSAFSDADLEEAKLSPDERARADWLYDDINTFMLDRFGLDWMDVALEAV
jgi:hypothetical protein